MKKIFFPLFAALALAACSGNDTPAVDGEGGQAVSVSISMPATRAGEGYVTATEAERTVKSLDAYLFDEADGKLEKVYRNLMTDDWTPATPEEGRTVTLDGIKDRAAKTVLFVANAGSTASLAESAAPGVFTKDDFMKLLTDQLAAAPTCPLMMTAEAQVPAWNEGDAPAVSAALQRVVARLDVKIWQETGFTLKKAELRGASTLSYIFPAASFAECGKLDFVNATPASEDVERTDHIGTYTDKLFKALFYMYAAPADQMTLRLHGVQQLGDKTADAIYDIPLSSMLQDAASIERNTCYTVVVKDIDVTADGEFKVTVDFDVQN